ncbi:MULTISPECIES: universal stress protein [unclassified Streptomyces]|uniref:universal stress protein n=1 Tax=unclassified Streptomyces TaxID=2593676 RepID=UPI001489D914|nr:MULTISPECIES: universal stress protein [unclassified Streptomyces]
MTSNRTADVVLVGVDASPQARSAADWAAAEAERHGWDLKLLHVVDAGALRLLGTGGLSEAADRAVQEADTMLHSAVHALTQRRPSMVVNATVVRGSPAAAILDAAEDTAMVVLGTRGHGGFAGLLLGSVSRRVAAHATRPVVVVRDPVGGPARRPVVAGVRDERDTDAVRFALAEGAVRNVPVRLIHAWTPIVHSGVMVPPIDMDEERRLHARVLNHAARPIMEYPQVHVDTEVITGPAAATLVDASSHAGLLVVPRHPPAERLGLRLGSVVHAVLHHAHCPVAVVPIP